MEEVVNRNSDVAVHLVLILSLALLVLVDVGDVEFLQEDYSRIEHLEIKSKLLGMYLLI